MPRAVRVEFSPSALVALACIALAGCTPDAFALRPDALQAGEFWRLLTAHLVHYSPQHAWLDASVVAICGLIAERGFGRALVGAALFGGALAIACVCLALPGLAEYRGASGLGVLLGVLAGAALWRERPEQRGWLVALAAVWCAKTALDACWPQLTLTDLPPGVRVAWPAHLAGAAGALAALAWRHAGASKLSPACVSTR